MILNLDASSPDDKLKESPKGKRKPLLCHIQFYNKVIDFGVVVTGKNTVE